MSQYYVDEYYNKKCPDAPITAASVMATDGNKVRLSTTASVADIGEQTSEIHLAPSDGTASPVKAVTPAAASTAVPAAPKPSGETFTVTKEELEACFGLGATARLQSHRRQRQLDEEQSAKKAKSGAPTPAPKVETSAMDDLKGLMTAPATLSTGKGQTWNQVLVEKIFAAMDASPALTKFITEHSAERRKLPSKELTTESLQASLKALSKITELSLQERVCGLASLLAVCVEVIKYRGADSLDMLVLLQRRWNLLGPQLFAEGGTSAELAPLIFKEVDRVASMSLKKFFQRTLRDDEQEAEDKFVTVLARHMMKKAYNPKGANSVAMQMAEDALDDKDQFETTSQGRELKKMFVDAGWDSKKEKDLEDAVYFRCELNQGLAQFLNINLVRLGRKVADSPNLVPQLVQALPQTCQGDPEGIFCGLACVLACCGIALADKRGAAVMLMLCPVTQLWSQLAEHLSEVDGVGSFVRLLDDAWVTASERFVEEAKETAGIQPVQPKRGDPPPSDEQMTATMCAAVKENIFQEETMNAVFGSLPKVEGTEARALKAVKAAKKAAA